MLDLGSTDNHSNRLVFTDPDQLDAPSSLTVACFLALNNLTIGAARQVCGDGDSYTGSNGWWPVIKSDKGCALRLRAGDPQVDASDNAVPNDTDVHSVVWRWSDAADTLEVFVDGVNGTAATHDGVPQAQAEDFYIGPPTTGNGLACKVGHLMVWVDYLLSNAEVQQYHAGETIPRPDLLTFWHKGLASPGKDEITQAAPTASGTVNIVSDPVDAYFGAVSSIPAWREVFSRELRRRRFPEEIYTLQVPLEYLVLEVLDDLNISHDSLPRAASLLTDIDTNYLMETWRRMYAVNTVQRIDLNNMSMSVSAVNAEPYINYAWATDMLPAAVTSEYDGQAQMDQGGTHYNERSSSMWLEQADGRIASLSSGRIPINHLGMLPCEGSKNPIQNSTFKNNGGITNWTSSGSGSFNAVTTETALLFVDKDTFPNFMQVVKGAGDSYKEQGSIAVLVGDAYRRLSFYYGGNEQINPGTLSWQIERPGPQYWNDATPGWQAGNVWNAAAQVTRWVRGYSEPITTPASENWTVRLGIVTGSTSDAISLGQVDLTVGPYLLAPIATEESSTYTTVSDERYAELDLGSDDNWRQSVPPRYGTFRCTFTAEQNGGDLPDDDELAIWYAQWDSSGNNYDVLLYQKLTGENVRFAFERWRNGAMEARALKDTTIVRGTAYELAARWTYDEFGTASTAGAMDLDGASDYYSLATDLAGNADGKEGLISVWIRLDGDDATLLRVMSSQGTQISIQRMTTNKIQIIGKDVGDTERLNLQSNTSFTSSATWLHVLASWDLANGNTYLYVNDVDELNEVTADNATIDYTRASYGIGAASGGGDKFNGAIAELYCNFATSLDLSDEDNRRLFVTSGLKPEYLGGDGSIPTGDAPLIYCPSGNAVNNCGKGGAFTENGAPAATGGPGPHRTLSVFVDGVKGTDAQAESNQPDFDRPELCPDPTCATDFFDSKGTGWTHDTTDDEYDCDGSAGADTDLTEGSICVSGRIYRVKFTVKNYSAGNICAVCGTQEGTDRFADGTYTEYITSNGTDFIIRGDLDFVGSVTDIYVCEDQYTGVWRGSAPSATGYLAANNYISNPEIIPRAIPDEEIQARR